MILAKLIGASSATGLTLSLCRRARSLFWSTIAGFCLITISISNKSPKLYALANGVAVAGRGMPHPIAERTKIHLLATLICRRRMSTVNHSEQRE